MVASGAEGVTPKERMVQLAAGLGLIDGVIVDQHFTQRNRFGRLLALVAHSPHLLGVGVDEDTAMVVTEGRYVEVLGKGAVTVFDGSRMHTKAYAAKSTRPLEISNVVLHSLPAGARFDLRTRTLVPEAPETDREVETGKRLNRVLAKRIAAEGADDRTPERAARRRQRLHAVETPTEGDGPRGRDRQGAEPRARQGEPRGGPRRPPARTRRPPQAAPARRRDADRGRRHVSEPAPELRVLETRVYRGPNYWSYDPAINML